MKAPSMHIQKPYQGKLSKFSQLSFCQKLYFLNQTPSCICSMCLHCIGKVSKVKSGHYSCENSLEEVQGVTTSSHIPPPLLQDTWPCIQLLRAERHASETWPLTKTNLQLLQRNDRAMIRQICSIKPEDVAMVRSSELLAKL